VYTNVLLLKEIAAVKQIALHLPQCMEYENIVTDLDCSARVLFKMGFYYTQISTVYI
jgi:hypothetical protein